MKKLLALLLVLAMAFSLFACGGEETADAGDDEETKPTESAEEKEETAKPNNDMVEVWLLSKMTSSNGVTYEVVRDEQNNLQRMKCVAELSGQQVSVEYQYTFDSRTGKNLSTAAAISGRPVRFITTNYDIYGNEIGESAEYVYGEEGKIVTVIADYGTTNCTYDTAGKLVKEVTVYDNGDTSERTYEYDAKGNLVKISDSNGNVATMTYDAEGRLLEDQNAAYPSAYVYDENGNIKQITFGHYGAVFTFQYEKVTVNKEYAAALQAQPECIFDNLYMYE